jgi:hypothetical protein
MKFIRFKGVRCKGDWEWNWVGKKYNLRIARSQFAFWINYHSLFNFKSSPPPRVFQAN